MDEQFLPGEFWDDLYRRQETRWDIGSVSTPIKEYIDQLTNKDLRILIPGAGSSYEAMYLAEKGFTDITVIDISLLLTERLQKTVAPLYPSINIITGDFFLLNGQFDLVIEQHFSAHSILLCEKNIFKKLKNC